VGRCGVADGGGWGRRGVRHGQSGSGVETGKIKRLVR
jgi:hypothetical protein